MTRARAFEDFQDLDPRTSNLVFPCLRPFSSRIGCLSFRKYMFTSIGFIYHETVLEGRHS